MKKQPQTVIMRDSYRVRLKQLAKEDGLTIGQFVEKMIDEREKKNG